MVRFDTPTPTHLAQEELDALEVHAPHARGRRAEPLARVRVGLPARVVRLAGRAATTKAGACSERRHRAVSALEGPPRESVAANCLHKAGWRTSGAARIALAPAGRAERAAAERRAHHRPDERRRADARGELARVARPRAPRGRGRRGGGRGGRSDIDTKEVRSPVVASDQETSTTYDQGNGVSAIDSSVSISSSDSSSSSVSGSTSLGKPSSSSSGSPLYMFPAIFILA